MDYYFPIITIIDVFTLGIMCILTRNNETLNKQQRQRFIMAFLLIMVISVLEIITVIVCDGPVSLRWLHILANYLGFGLTPAVPVFLAAALDKNQSTKYALFFELIYLIFLAVTLPQKLVFYVDPDNHYMRGDFFFIYLVCYFISIFYLMVITLRVTKAYQNKSKNSVYLIVGFLLAGTIVQVIFPDIHVTWLCVTLLAMLFFTYCNGMWQQLDRLTGLLNQNSYLNKTASLSQSGTLLIFDVDDFKQVNDTYGHLNGDKCLETIATCMKKAYFKDGFCYRIGGDEFCVLLNKDADAEGCYKKFEKELDNRRKALAFLPYVSSGSASFVVGDDILKVKETADQMLYQVKKEKKTAGTDAHNMLYYG